MNLEELSHDQLRQLRPQLGEVGQARVDELLGVACNTPAPASGSRNEPNGWEFQYAAVLRADPDVERFEFNAVRLRLADGAWYKPDYWVLYRDGHEEMHEVKGHWRSRDRVRVKVAARLYGWRWTFRAVHKRTKKEGGGWSVESFSGQ